MLTLRGEGQQEWVLGTLTLSRRPGGCGDLTPGPPDTLDSCCSCTVMSQAWALGLGIEPRQGQSSHCLQEEGSLGLRDWWAPQGQAA